MSSRTCMNPAGSSLPFAIAVSLFSHSAVRMAEVLFRVTLRNAIHIAGGLIFFNKPVAGHALRDFITGF